jgi:hypothetical protein
LLPYLDIGVEQGCRDLRHRLLPSDASALPQKAGKQVNDVGLPGLMEAVRA